MRKGVMFVSIILTTFVLVAVAGVAYAYRSLAAPKPVAQQQQFINSEPIRFPLNADPAVTAPDVSAQDAASIAAKYLNHTDLYSVELSNFNSVQTYKVTFSSGDVVFVGMKGEVLAAQPPPPPVVVSAPAKRRGGGGGNSNASGGGGGEHDHEEHDD